MTEITTEAVAAAAEAIEKRNEVPTVKSVREFLGGGSNTTLTPLVRAWKQTRAKSIASNVKVSSSICDLIVAQIQDVATQAALDANLRAEEAEDAFDELVVQVGGIEKQLLARNEELAAVQTQLLLRQGELDERGREIEKIRLTSTQAIAEAGGRATDERAQAESLRQELVRSNLLLQAVPSLETALEDARQLVKAANDEVSRARLAEAVAIERAQGQEDRARDALAREAKSDAQLQGLRDELAKGLAAERVAQQDILRLSTMVSSLEARSTVQLAENARLREAQNDAKPVPASPQQEERRTV